MNITSITKGIVKFIVTICAPMYEKWFNFYYHAGGTIRKMYYETRLKKCGTGLVVYGKTLLFQLHKISIGNHVTINNGVQIAPRGNVVIGDYVTLSRNAQIIAGQLDTSIYSGGYKNIPHIGLDVNIGEGTWLCVNSIVLPGVNISGKGVIVAAGAVVTKDISEDYVVVAGVPAQIVKRLLK